MIKIEIRQNGKFKLGYPYHNTIDKYFESLSDEFITSYNLTKDEIKKINNYKNSILQFDRDLHKFILDLSIFKKEFETQGLIIINEFNKLKKNYNEIKEKVEILIKRTNYYKTELTYIKDNIKIIQDDLEKVNEMILFYQSQLFDETFVYSDNYIDETKKRLEIINKVFEQNNTEEEYYLNILKNKIKNFTDSLDQLKHYGGFKEISLRNLYESWQKRSEIYYTSLVEYFSDEYNSFWTYGKSLMYGEKKSISDARKKEVEYVYEEWKQTLIKGYEFKLEKKLKIYSLAWFNKRDTFELVDFTRSIEYERKRILEQELTNIEKLISEKTFALRSVIPSIKEKNYFKYIETIQLKREHIYKNLLTNTIDLDLLKKYDYQINELENDYLFVKNKMEQDTYWIYFYDLERYKILYSEVKRWYDITLTKITRNFQKEINSNNQLYEKINFYKNEQIEFENKINDLIKLKDKLEIEYNSLNDELTLLQSKIYKTKQLMDKKIDEYTKYFLTRISFFVKDDQKSEEDKISELLDGNFFNELEIRFQKLKLYKNQVIWWNDNDKKKLFEYYSFLLHKISNIIKEEWELEFNSEILANKKVNYYSYYIEKKLKIIYAKIHKFILNEKFDDNIQVEIDQDFKNIKQHFIKLIDFAFEANQDISFNPDIFDYDKKFIFRISEGLENKENIISTIDGFINNVKSYLSQKNLWFKEIKKQIENMNKIEAIWNDLEKIHV